MDQSEAYLVYVTYLVSISLSFQPMKQCLDSFLCYCEFNLEYQKSRSKWNLQIKILSKFKENCFIEHWNIPKCSSYHFMPQVLFCILSLVFLGYYNTVGNTNGRLDLEGVFDSIGATSREDFNPVKKGKHTYFVLSVPWVFKSCFCRRHIWMLH